VVDRGRFRTSPKGVEKWRMHYAGAFTGDTISDFVTDNIWHAGISSNVGRSGERQYRDAAFVQDDRKITRT